MLCIVCEGPQTLWVGFIPRTRLRCGWKGCIVRVFSMSAERLRNMWKQRVFVWLCRGVTCVDVMAAAMHRCSHQGESKQTWQQNGKKCSSHYQSLLFLSLYLYLLYLMRPLGLLFASWTKDVIISAPSHDASESISVEYFSRVWWVEPFSLQWAKTDVSSATVVTFTTELFFFFVCQLWSSETNCLLWFFTCDSLVQHGSVSTGCGCQIFWCPGKTAQWLHWLSVPFSCNH